MCHSEKVRIYSIMTMSQHRHGNEVYQHMVNMGEFNLFQIQVLPLSSIKKRSEPLRYVPGSYTAFMDMNQNEMLYL